MFSHRRFIASRQQTPPLMRANSQKHWRKAPLPFSSIHAITFAIVIFCLPRLLALSLYRHAPKPRDSATEPRLSWGPKNSNTSTFAAFLSAYSRNLSSTNLQQPQAAPPQRLRAHVKSINKNALAHPHDNALAAIDALLDTPKARILNSNPPSNARFILYRGIGNDLPPRHTLGQSFSNVKFILENEPALPQLDRRWYLNRHVRPTEELRILRLLIDHNETFTRDPVDFDEYAKLDYNLPHHNFLHSHSFFSSRPQRQSATQLKMMYDKNQYIVHCNPARNNMIRLGKETGAAYILPWDGNCFLNVRAWREITEAVNATEKEVEAGGQNVTFKYFAVNMARMTDNEPLKDPEYAPRTAYEEPQIMIHRSAKETFDEHLEYGMRDKVELLWRLRIRGGWNVHTPGEGIFQEHAGYSDDVPGKHAARRGGWVARLSSGVAQLEQKGAAIARGTTRTHGMMRLMAEASEYNARTKLGYSNMTLLWYDERALERNRDAYNTGEDKALVRLVKKLESEAEEEIANGALYAVVDKPKAGPSGDKHDYVSSVPLLERGSSSKGDSVTGKSDWDDGVEFALFSQKTVILTLAGYFTGKESYYEKAAQLVRTWFIDESTRMKPNMKYGHLTVGENQTQKNSTSSGIADGVNFVIVFDAVRLLHKAAALSGSDMDELRKWGLEYLDFLQDSPQGKIEYTQTDHRGILFDAQVGSVGAFVGDFGSLIWQTSTARTRMYEQFRKDGSLRHGGDGRGRLHYTMCCMTAWVWLGRVAERCGIDVWKFGETEEEAFLKLGMRHNVPFFSNAQWTHEEVGKEDLELMLLLYFQGRHAFPDMEVVRRTATIGENIVEVPQSLFDAKAVSDGSALMPPFWNLAMFP